MTTRPELAPEVEQIAQLVEHVERWLVEPCEQLRRGRDVLLDFCPGDGTRYRVHVAPLAHAAPFAATDEQRRYLSTDCETLLLLTWLHSDVSLLVSHVGSPVESYVAERLQRSTGSDPSPYTVAALGVLWSLLIGTDVETVALSFSQLPAHVWNDWTAVDAL